jgi:hypothetical protein
MTVAGSRTADDERDEARRANRGGFAFLLVHGVTWTGAGILSFALATDQAALVYLFQGLVAFPASLLLERMLGFRLVKASDNSVVGLFVLIAMTQGLSLPAAIIVYNLDPLYLPIVFAATNGGHFLPYLWLHRTRAYGLLAVVAALGPFGIVLARDAQTAFHAAGFLVGAVMLATAAYIWWRTGEERTTIDASNR